MAVTINMAAPVVKLKGDLASTHTITIGLDFDGSAYTWSALVRRKPTSGDFFEWTVDDTNAGTPSSITVDGVVIPVDGTIAITANFAILTKGTWYWSLFRDNDTFIGVSQVTVLQSIEEP